MSAMYNMTYPCPVKTHKACADRLAKELHMRIVKTLDNGDCFFDTLSKYGRAYDYAPLNHSPRILRHTMVDYMENHVDEIEPYILMNRGKTPISMIRTLRKEGVWDNHMGDLLSQIASDVFRVNLFIYNVDPPNIRRIRVNQRNYETGPVHMLRIHDSHYELLLPHDAPLPSSVQPYSPKQSLALANNSNAVHSITQALSRTSLHNRTKDKNHTRKNTKKEENTTDAMLIRNRETIQEYDKITVKRLHHVLRSLGMSEEEIQEQILSLPKREQKTAYYDQYISLLS